MVSVSQGPIDTPMVIVITQHQHGSAVSLENEPQMNQPQMNQPQMNQPQMNYPQSPELELCTKEIIRHIGKTPLQE